ncbi:MAG: hypothetical protein ACFCUN_02790 [Hyphomicrobiaceae bacterium]
MQFSVHFENTDGTGPRSGPVTVGWLFTSTKGSIIYDPPQRVRSADLNRTHAKSASRCPAVINLESRYFEIKCPYDLKLEFVRDGNGRPDLRNQLGDSSPIRVKKLREQIVLVAESEWRYRDRPTLQMMLPYIFIADEPVYLSQVAPFLHYAPEPLPGTIFGGRFPINVWPRPLMWAFEWHDITRPLVLRRGDPLFYVQFETYPQDRGVQVVEAEETPELRDYLDRISGAVNFVNQTFSLFKAAEAVRPERLVVPAKR